MTYLICAVSAFLILVGIIACVKGPAEPQTPIEGRWRIEPFLDGGNDWSVRIFNEDGKCVHDISGWRGHYEHARTRVIEEGKDWCDTQEAIEAARARDGGVIWHGTPSVPSLQKRIAELEAELLDNHPEN